MELLDLIEAKKKELNELADRKVELENEIRELKERVDHEPEKLKNPDSRYNPVLLVEESCHLCRKQLICSYHSKKDYSRFKNLHVRQTKQG